MSLIPQNPVTQEDLILWYNLKQQIKSLKALTDKEMLLRKKIFGGIFPNPREGVNAHTMPDGYIIKGTYKIDRKVELAVLKSNTESFIERGVSPDSLIEYKPELVLSAYRQLTEEQAAIFDECLIIKPASPDLVIVPPAPPKGGKKTEV